MEDREEEVGPPSWTKTNVGLGLFHHYKRNSIAPLLQELSRGPGSNRGEKTFELVVLRRRKRGDQQKKGGRLLLSPDRKRREVEFVIY